MYANTKMRNMKKLGYGILTFMLAFLLIPLSEASLNTDFVEVKVNYNSYVVEDLPASLDIVLKSDGTSDLTTDAVRGVQEVLINKSGTPIVNFSINFSQDINFSDISADINTTSAKSVVKINTTTHTYVTSNFTLRIPVVNATGKVYVCPTASNIDEVYLGCSGLYWLSDQVNESGYYEIEVTGTGGGEGEGTQNKTILEKEGAYALKLNVTGDELYGIINSQVVSYPVASPTSWHHFAMTYDGAQIKLFLDGAEVANQTYSTAISTNANPANIGKYFTGFIDNVKVYNTSLTSTEIEKLYYQGIDRRRFTLLSNETVRSENWSVNVWGSDNLQLSTPVLSNYVYIENAAPELTSISAATNPIKGGESQVITPVGVGDDDLDDLYLYCCNDTIDACTPTASLNVCSEGSESSPYAGLQCSYTVASLNTTLYVRCRTYDGTSYSSTTASTNFVVDSAAPTVTVESPGAYVSGTVIFNATAIDSGSGLQDNSCVYSIESGAPSYAAALDNFSDTDEKGRCYKSLDTMTLTNGTLYTINFKVNDSVDNEGIDATPETTYICNDIDVVNCGQACVDGGNNFNGSGFDNFSFEAGTANCCGDDASEEYVSNLVLGVSYDACCDNALDCVDATGACRGGTETGNCDDGFDNDCDGYIDSLDSDCCPTIGATVFKIKNSTGTDCMQVDTDGDVAIKGITTESCLDSEGTGDFVVKSGATTVAWINHSNCNLCIDGTINQNEGTISASSNEFLILNSASTYVLKIDNSGNLYATGSVGSQCGS